MKILRRNLHSLTQFFDGGAGGGNGGGAAGGQGGGGGPLPFNAREHLADDGSFKPDWHKAAGVSESLAKKFTRPEALARSYETLEKQIGAKGIIVPGPNATADEKNAYYKALGRPDKPEDYGFTRPEKVKVGDRELPVPELAWDDKRAKDWQQFLHAEGAPKELAQKIMLKATGESAFHFEGIEQSKGQYKEQAKAALQKEWGADYDKNIAAAQRAAKQFGGDELANHPGLGFDPVMIKALAKIGAATAERPGTGTRQQAGNDSMSAAEANVAARNLTKQIADRTKADRTWGTSPEAVQMKAEKSRLFQLANPER